MPLTRTPAFARAVFETIRQPMLVLSEDLRIEIANDAFHQAFDTTPPEVDGLPFAEVAEGALSMPELNEVLAEGSRISGLELRRDFPRIGARIFAVDAARIAGEEPADRHLLVSLEDVTERRRAERERERYAREMERSNRDLEDFAHAASHDLQEPLRKVRAFADRLSRSFQDGQLDERQREYVERLHAATLRMQLRIDDLLRLARVSRATRKPEVLELSAIVAAVLGDMEGHIAEYGAIVDVGELPAIEADASQMELLFQNLVSNSLKYRKPEVPPEIRIASAALDPPPDDPRDWYEVTITDNGIGFDQAYAQQIFRPFERLHAQDEYEGSGIGLSVCRRVVEIHGGRIHANATAGQGATFTVQLPRVQNASEI